MFRPLNFTSRWVRKAPVTLCQAIVYIDVDETCNDVHIPVSALTFNEGQKEATTYLEY